MRTFIFSALTFLRIFQDFFRSKLRFSRKLICSKEYCCSLYDQISLQEKYSVIIMYVFLKNFQNICCFSFFQDFSMLEIYFPFSRFSRFSRCQETPETYFRYLNRIQPFYTGRGGQSFRKIPQILLLF